LDFLNELLKYQEGRITELSYLPNEKLPISVGDRRAIFDIYCTNEKGEQFIVEMQKPEQMFFKDRTIFYLTFPIQEQARNKDRDILNIRNTAFEKGIEKGKTEMAKEMLKKNEPVEKIIRYTGLTEREINGLKNK